MRYVTEQLKALLAEQRHTNLKSAVAEAHERARADGKAYFVYGESGVYRVSATRPEGELRYIKVTPSGREWTYSYDGAAERYRMSRLGWLGPAEIEEPPPAQAGQEEALRIAEGKQRPAMGLAAERALDLVHRAHDAVEVLRREALADADSEDQAYGDRERALVLASQRDARDLAGMVERFERLNSTLLAFEREAERQRG